MLGICVESVGTTAPIFLVCLNDVLKRCEITTMNSFLPPLFFFFADREQIAAFVFRFLPEFSFPPFASLVHGPEMFAVPSPRSLDRRPFFLAFDFSQK